MHRWKRRAIPVAPTGSIPRFCPSASSVPFHLVLAASLAVTCPQSSFPRFGACQQATAGTLLRICPRFPSAVRKGFFFLYTESCGIESPFFSCQRAERPEGLMYMWGWSTGCSARGEELGVLKWLTCHTERTPAWKSCLGFLLAESCTHSTQTPQFAFSSSLPPEPQRRQSCMKQNTFKYWKHLKTQPFTTGKRFLSWSSPTSAHQEEGRGWQRGSQRARAPFLLGSRQPLGPLAAGMRLKESWAPSVAVHCLSCCENSAGCKPKPSTHTRFVVPVCTIKNVLVQPASS